MNAWFTEHMGITYVLIFVMIAFVYHKVFRPPVKISILKTLIIYLLIAVGSVMLLIFQIDASLPIVQSLAVAILMMALYRLRLMFASRRGQIHSSEHDKEG